jgi:hypothetical protein
MQNNSLNGPLTWRKIKILRLNLLSHEYKLGAFHWLKRGRLIRIEERL